MSWDATPWFVGGGAIHSPEVARLMAYAATSGSEGIIDAGDLTVAPLAVPAGSVRVRPGSAVIRSRYTGGDRQTYIARLPIENVASIAATGSAGGRTDMVIARVEDPFMAGSPYQAPANPTTAQYVFTRILSNVPTSAVATPEAARRYLRDQGQSAIPLAAVTLPASTSTVLQSHIKSLREMASPRRRREVRTLPIPVGTSETLTNTSSQVFPAAATGVIDSYEIPEWATVARIVATWSQAKMNGQNVTGQLWTRLSTTDGNGVRYDTPASGGASRGTFVNGDSFAIPASLRGTVVTIAMRGRLETGQAANGIIMDSGSSVVMDVEFLEAAIESTA